MSNATEYAEFIELLELFSQSDLASDRIQTETDAAVLQTVATRKAEFASTKAVRDEAEEKIKALAALEESRGALLAVQNLQRRAREVSHAIEKAAAVFEGEKQKCLKRLYPLGIISRALKNIRKFLGGNYFSKRDLERLLPLINMARILADLIDRRILDEKGNVV